MKDDLNQFDPIEKCREASFKLKIKIPLIKEPLISPSYSKGDQNVLFECSEFAQNQHLHDYRDSQTYKSELFYESSILKKDSHFNKDQNLCEGKGSKRRYINSSLVQTNFQIKSPLISRSMLTTASSKYRKVPVIKPKRDFSNSKEFATNSAMSILSLIPKTKKAPISTANANNSSRMISKYILKNKNEKCTNKNRDFSYTNDWIFENAADLEVETVQALERDDSYHFMQNIF